MSEVLEIENIRAKNQNTLILNGRLDAFGSRTLEDELLEQIKSGQYRIVLNFQEVNFLSSAGIRVLIKFYKELKTVGGYLEFTNMTDKVSHVIKLAGLDHLFTETQEENHTDLKTDHIDSASASFKILKKEADTLKLELFGKPEFFNSKGYSKKDIQHLKFEGDTYALGLGAIGDDFEECKNRIGEYLAVGNTAIYMPTDGTKSVDYMQRSNQLIPNVMSLYSLVFKGTFGTFLNFDTKETLPSTPLSELAETIFNTQNTQAVGVVMIAETSGLCGCNLNTSPIEEDATQILSYPGVKENMSFTTELEFEDSVTLTTGIIHRDNKELKEFSRPLKKGSDLEAHFHSAVLDFKPIKKENSDMDTTINNLLENSRLKGVLHLLNDDRPLSGIGESGFKRGVCWIGPIVEFEKAMN